MKKQAGYHIFIAVFILLCLVPSVGMLLPERETAGANEILTPLPALRDAEGTLNTDYLTNLTDYVEDRFFLRQDLVTAWSALNQRLLHTSIADSVLLGRDGWLYFGETLDDYTGAAPMTAGETAAAAHNLALVSEYCAGQGAAFLFTVAPNKNSIYPQHMPDLPVFSAHKNAEALAEALAEEGVAYYDLFAALRNREETLYFRQDSHWNSKGAALAADGINAALGRQSNYFAGPFQPSAVHRSDLYAMLYPAGAWLEEDQCYGGELTFDYEAPVRSENDLNIRTTSGGSGSLLMFRDSFGGLLYPYLADSFGKAHFSRAAAYRLDQIAVREADFVVVELVERNLRWLLENVPVMPAPLRTGMEAAQTLDTPAALTAEAAQALPGYVLIRGTLPAIPDDGSLLYLQTAEECYEAFRLEADGFGLYVPESILAEPSGLVCTAAGERVSIPAVYHDILEENQ